jgi:hypothetical protein
MSIRDFHMIMSDKVADVDFLMKNFPVIFKQETKSINNECGLQVQN